MMPRLHDPDSADEGLSHKRARYEMLRMLLIGLLVSLVLASLLLLVLQGQQVRKNQRIIEGLARNSASQAAQVKAVLDRQKAADDRRSAEMESLVARISAEQRRALVAHDRATQDFLRRNFALISTEVYAPGNRENQSPRPAVTSVFIGPVAPRRVAPTCQPTGKSGRCK